MIVHPIFIEAQTNWIRQIWLILISLPGLSFPNIIWWELVQTSGGLPYLNANMIINAYGLNASSSLISVFHIPWCSPSGLDEVLSLMVSSRITWDTPLLNDQNCLARASFNTPTHQQWCFQWQYHAILNSLSTINPHYYVKYSQLNHIVKRIVKIDPYIWKIKWFADFVLALMTTRV